MVSLGWIVELQNFTGKSSIPAIEISSGHR